MLGKANVKYALDGLQDFQLYRTITGGNDSSSGYSALAGTVTQGLGALAASAGSFLDLSYSIRGSTNVIYAFMVGNGGVAVPFTLRMCLNGAPTTIYSQLTGAALFVTAASAAGVIGTMYTFTNLPAARYIITADSGITSGTVYLYTAMSGPQSGLYEAV